MSKLKKALLMGAAYVLVIALAIGGTVAYLTDTDSDVNVMTLGNVSIEQHEYERVINSDGEYELITTNRGEGYKLQEFTQNKPLYPSMDQADAEWDTTPVNLDQLETGRSAMDVFTEKLAVDKFVFVENTGKTAAYVRTLIAFELGSVAPEDWSSLIMTSHHFTWDDPETIGVITVDDNNYIVVEYVYKGYNEGDTHHAGGILPAGEITYNSLAQVYMTAAATNEDVEALDGNDNGKYDILVLSQAVQAAGFTSADTALDTAFGAPDYINPETGISLAAEWLGGTMAEHSLDTWDGTIDISWYDSANPLSEYSIYTAEQLAGLAELVSNNVTFNSVTFTLMNDLDLYCEDTTAAADGDPLSFRPIGDTSKNGTFEGIFNGNGKIIYNLYQNGWDLGYEWGKYGSYGLFGNLNNATVKNLTISGAESYIEGGDVGGITGSATGTCIFENITIIDSIFATYNNGNGGIIGWSGNGNYTFKNITIAEDVTLAGLWGSFDSSIGGIVGQAESGATYNFENVNTACRLDVYNDVTASYDYYNYRMCGMIIGRLKETTTINGNNYPDTTKYTINCNNVNVTYGEWANYHYCRRALTERGKRVEAGYSYDGIAADYDHSVCNVHHMECIAFDQIFGGAQYGVKGLSSYSGVTVIYNNK